MFRKHFAAACLALALGVSAPAQGLPAELKPKVELKLKALLAWGSDPAVVSAVKAYNTSPPPETRGMTNEKWKGLTVLDPVVRGLTRNPLATHLKTVKDDAVTECFVSGADGGKVAFLAKTTSWTHKGKDKHMVPMSGKTWIGPVEVDESTGQQQVQVSFPVLDGGKPIGSVVVGLGLAKLK